MATVCVPRLGHSRCNSALQAVEVPGHRVERGFSGAAVYDQQARAVVGIVVAEDKLAEAKLA
jgi:hypothetical protein